MKCIFHNRHNMWFPGRVRGQSSIGVCVSGEPRLTLGRGRATHRVREEGIGPGGVEWCSTGGATQTHSPTAHKGLNPFTTHLSRGGAIKIMIASILHSDLGAHCQWWALSRHYTVTTGCLGRVHIVQHTDIVALHYMS